MCERAAEKESIVAAAIETILEGRLAGMDSLGDKIP